MLKKTKTVGYSGKIVYDHNRSDGTPKKLMDSSRLNALGWNAKVGIEIGLKKNLFSVRCKCSYCFIARAW